MTSTAFEDLQEFEMAVLRDRSVVEISRGFLARSLASSLKRSLTLIGKSPPHSFLICRDFDLRFAVLIGTSFKRCPDFLRSGRKAAYLFDATPPWASPERIATFCLEAGISDVFVGHPDFVKPIASLQSDLRVHFVPEAIDPSGYLPSQSKDVDVLEFGRKLKGFHQQLKPGLEKEGVSHWHEYIETRTEFLSVLGRAKIVVCFPRSLTEGTLDIPMLTMRYFQGMASKALILGTAPPLLVKLFGYNPVIEADKEDPCGQVVEILKNWSDYGDLIERNYQTVLRDHTWDCRWAEIRRILES